MRPLIKRGILLGIISIVILGWNLALSTQRKNLGGSFKLVNKENVMIKVHSPGKIEPKDQITIRSELDGRKLNVFVKAGEAVEEGDILMEISDDNIRVQLNQKRNSANNARADMQKARKDYLLERSLYKQQAVPRRDVDNAKQAYERAKQAYEIAEEELKLTDKKAMGAKVKSPMTGFVIKSHVERNDFISSGKELFVVAKLDEFLVRGKVDELDIARVKEGQEVIIKCDAFPNKIIDGVVDWIGAQAGDGAFAEIDVLIKITNLNGVELKPNLSAEASIITGTISDGIVVPSKSVRTHPKEGTHVLVKKAGGWLVKRPVKVAHVNFDEAIISDGLSSGESILVPQED